MLPEAVERAIRDGPHGSQSVATPSRQLRDRFILANAIVIYEGTEPIEDISWRDKGHGAAERVVRRRRGEQPPRTRKRSGDCMRKCRAAR